MSSRLERTAHWRFYGKTSRRLGSTRGGRKRPIVKPAASAASAATLVISQNRRVTARCAIFSSATACRCFVDSCKACVREWARVGLVIAALPADPKAVAFLAPTPARAMHRHSTPVASEDAASPSPLHAQLLQQRAAIPLVWNTGRSAAWRAVSL